MNNFQELQAKNMAGFHQSNARIKKQFDKTRELYQLIGNIVELYIPAVVDTFDDFFGGDSQDKSKLNNKEQSNQ